MSRVGELTAYEIVHRFISETSKGLDVSAVFSPQCYQLWLITRKKPPKYPEQSFHRTIVTHLRGTDTRRPFAPEVEASLLQLIRDRSRNVWSGCFPGYRHNVGLRKFKHLGYHEAISKGEKKPRKTYTRLHYSQEPSLEPLVLTKGAKGGSLWDELVEICAVTKGGFVTNVELQAKKLGMTIFPPAIEFMLKSNTVSGTDPRLDLKFVLPDEAEFDHLLPLGRFTFDNFTGVVVDSSKCTNILGTDLTGSFIFSHNSSLFEAWYGGIVSFKKLLAQGSIWRRLNLRTSDGTIRLFLMKVTQGNNFADVIIQDITTQFPDHYRTPFLV